MNNNFFSSWDDEWGEANVSVPEPEPQVVQPQIMTQPETHFFEEPKQKTEQTYSEPVFKEEAPLQNWLEDDGWGTLNTTMPSEPAPQPVVQPVPAFQQPVQQVVKEEPVLVAKPEVKQVPKEKPRKKQPVVVAATQPSSWGVTKDTSLFANPQSQKTKQKPVQEKKSKQQKRVAQTKTVKSQQARQKPAEVKAPEPVTSEDSLVVENKKLKGSLAEMSSQMQDLVRRIEVLEHSKRLLYNSVCTLNSSGGTIDNKMVWTDEFGGDILPAQPLAYQLTDDGTGMTIMNDGLYEISFNAYGSDPYIQINGETYATGHTNRSSCYVSICVFVAQQPVITCHVRNVQVGNACDHYLVIRRFPS